MIKFFSVLGMFLALTFYAQASEPVTNATNEFAIKQLRQRIKSSIKIEDSFKNPGFEADFMVSFKISDAGKIEVIKVDNAHAAVEKSIRKQIEKIKAPYLLADGKTVYTLPVKLKYKGN